MAIQLTESAAKQIRAQLEKRGRGLGLRVGVKKVGCSGFAYTYDYADEVGADDRLFESHGTKVVVVHDSWAYFAERFGLKIVAAVEPHPGSPPSPAELAALFERMREAKIRIVIAEPNANPALVRQVADKGGAKAVTLVSSGADYIGLFDENVKRLLAVLKAD